MTHNKLQVIRGHVILKRDDMPHQPNPAKRPKLDFCRKHPKLIRDMLCATHNTMQCTLCCFKEHQNCVVKSLDEISTVEVKAFNDLINGFKKTLASVKTSVNQNVDEIRTTRQKMLEEAKNDYDTIVARAGNFLEETK